MAGVHIQTLYSGMDCPMMALAMIMQALALRHAVCTTKFKVVNYSAFDTDETCKRVLLASLNDEHPWGPQHVFDDFTKLLPENLQTKLRDIEHEVSQLLNVRLANLDEMQGLDKSQYKKDKKAILVELAHLMSTEMDKVLWTWSFDVNTKAYCHRHGCDCLVRSGLLRGRSRVRGLVVGSTCTDDSAMERRRPAVGPVARTFNVMVAYITQDLPGFFVHENSHLFQHARLEQRLPMYDVMSV